MATVLARGPSRLFPLDSQGKLHDETIDGGLAQIYRGYLEAAQRQLAVDGLAVRASLLAGKTLQPNFTSFQVEPSFAPGSGAI